MAGSDVIPFALMTATPVVDITDALSDVVILYKTFNPMATKYKLPFAMVM